MIKRIFFCFFYLSVICCFAQKSAVWEDYKKAQKNNTEAILPNFSYVGYKYSEVPIPIADYKVFDITKYGAIPNDTKSDKKAIEKAIKAAEKNGSGIVYIPKGKFYINTPEDNMNVIQISSSKIVFRGEDRNESIIFLEVDQKQTNEKQLWSTPASIQTKTTKGGKKLANITADVKRSTNSIQVDDASKIKEGDWITISVLNNSLDLVISDLYPMKLEEGWKKIKNKGVKVNEHHKVAKVIGNTILLVSVVHYDIKARHGWKIESYTPLDHIGFENLTFEGNWTLEFVHHKNAQHDGGWRVLELNSVVDSWVKDVTFRNVSTACSFKNSAASTALNILVDGNRGHNVGTIAGCTGVLLAASEDKAGMHHSFGVSGGSSSGNVIWRCKYTPTTCFESHASQPRTTLFDNLEGGFMQGRAGGARQNLPNHGKELVLWNYKETDKPEENFNFVSKKTWYWRIVPPIVVGFHGAGTTFNKDEVGILESLGTPVQPESLFEEQLKLRLGYLPEWINDYNNNK